MITPSSWFPPLQLPTDCLSILEPQWNSLPLDNYSLCYLILLSSGPMCLELSLNSWSDLWTHCFRIELPTNQLVVTWLLLMFFHHPSKKSSFWGFAVLVSKKANNPKGLLQHVIAYNIVILALLRWINRFKTTLIRNKFRFGYFQVTKITWKYC